jgi:hypothetical protein
MSQQVIKKHYNLVRSVNEPSKNSFEGAVNFALNGQGSQWCWNPWYSMFRTRFRILCPNITFNQLEQPKIRHALGPNMYFHDCFFQRECMKINGVPVEEMNNNVPQISALKNRMEPQSVIKNQQDSLEWSNSLLDERVQKIASDGDHFDGDDQYIYYKRNIVGLTMNDGTPVLTTHTFALADTGIITFANAPAAFDYREIFKVGDILTIVNVSTNDNNVYKYNLTVSRVLTALTVSTIGTPEALAAKALGGLSLLNNAGDVGAAGSIDGVDEAGIYLTRKKPNRNANLFEIMWRPKLGFFKLNQWLPNGDYTLELQPYSHEQYMKNAIESQLNMTPVTNFDSDVITSRLQYRVEIIDMRFHPYVGQFLSSPSGSYNIAFESVDCNIKSLNDNSLVNRDFKIKKNTHAITLAFQDPDVLNDTRRSITKFKIRNDFEQKLSRFYIKRGSATLPTPQYDISIDNAKDYMKQIYFENLAYMNKLNHVGGVEKYQEWLDKGLYIHYDVSDYGQGDDMLQVSQQFSEALPTNVVNILVFHHYYQGYRMDMANGRIDKIIPVQ